MIRVGTGRYAPPHSSSGTPSYRPYSVSSGGEAVLAQLLGRRLVGDDEGDLVQRVAERAGDAGDRAVDERGERDVPRGARPPIGVTGAAAALRHGARILAAMAVDPVRPIEPWAPDVALAPGPDPAREPEGFVVAADDGSRLHFLDWGAPDDDDGPGVLLVPGLLQPAASWAPVARRLARARRTVVADLRGQGLSDSPMTGYDLGDAGVGRRRGRGGLGAARPAGGSSSRATGSAGSSRSSRPRRSASGARPSSSWTAAGSGSR